MANLRKEYSWAVVPQLVINFETSVNMPFFAKPNIPFVGEISSAHANGVQIPLQETISSGTLMQADSRDWG